MGADDALGLKYCFLKYTSVRATAISLRWLRFETGVGSASSALFEDVRVVRKGSEMLVVRPRDDAERNDPAFAKAEPVGWGPSSGRKCQGSPTSGTIASPACAQTHHSECGLSRSLPL